MNDITGIMISLIRSEVCENTPDLLKNYHLIPDKMLIETLILARKHAVGQIVASALLKNGILEGRQIKSMFEKEMYTAVFLYEKIKSVCDRVYSLFEADSIYYIPLKGAVIRSFYPDPWMRSSCDIDILVKEKEIDKAVTALTGTCGFVLKIKTKHDVVLESDEGICVELHYKLLGDKGSPLYSKQLADVWKYAVPCSEESCEHKLSDDYFYYYLLLHMAKHFRIGGCGIRSFLDLWLINNSNQLSFTDKKDLFLRVGNLFEFESQSRRLSEVWFSDCEHNEVTIMMGKYIVDGGSFGSLDTRMISDKERHKNSFNYILSKIFVPISTLKAEYPTLDRFPVLAPFFYLIRIFSFLTGNKKGFAKKRLSSFKAVQTGNDLDGLFEKLEI